MLNIEVSAAAMTEVERQLKINEDVLRYLTIKVEELDNEPSVILARREKEEKKAKARAEFAASEFEVEDEAEEA